MKNKKQRANHKFYMTKTLFEAIMTKTLFEAIMTKTLFEAIMKRSELTSKYYKQKILKIATITRNNEIFALCYIRKRE